MGESVKPPIGILHVKRVTVGNLLIKMICDIEIKHSGYEINIQRKLYIEYKLVNRKLWHKISRRQCFTKKKIADIAVC